MHTPGTKRDQGGMQKWEKEERTQVEKEKNAYPRNEKRPRGYAKSEKED